MSRPLVTQFAGGCLDSYARFNRGGTVNHRLLHRASLGGVAEGGVGTSEVGLLEGREGPVL